MLELTKAVKDLNKGKARDPGGLCSELFQTDVMGASLKESLLQMLNSIKYEGSNPSFMRESIVITIPKKSNPYQTLEVDCWDIKYDNEDKLLETEGGKISMEEVSKNKYLGFVVSRDASNVANISDKRNRSFSTIRSITNMIKGLKTYTVQNGLIYLNSLLLKHPLRRGNILQSHRKTTKDD